MAMNGLSGRVWCYSFDEDWTSSARERVDSLFQSEVDIVSNIDSEIYSTNWTLCSIGQTMALDQSVGRKGIVQCSGVQDSKCMMVRCSRASVVPFEDVYVCNHGRTS